MNDIFSNDLKKGWLFLSLLLFSFWGLRAQCAGPFNLACISEVNLTLNDTCGGVVTYDMVVTGFPACLTEDNFTVVVEDGNTDNGATVDGPGRFRYTVVGKNNPDLVSFTCWGYVTASDITPPVIAPLSPNPVVLGCGRWVGRNVSALPAEVSKCYQVTGASGDVVPGTLAPELRAILLQDGGLPMITDACAGVVEVCVNDVLDAPAGSECNDTIRMVRTYTATQLPEGTDVAPAVSAQEFFFLRPDVEQLIGVESAIFVSCEDFQNGSPNPVARPTDYPYFNTSDGRIYLNRGFCQYQVVTFDGERINGCGDNFTFVRSFQVMDWCLEIDTTFVQTVRVGDMEPPTITLPTQDNDFDGIADEGPLRFPTNTAACAAIINTRNGGVAVTDACGSRTTLEAFVYLDAVTASVPLGPFQVFSDNVQEALTLPVPVGRHLLRYVAKDACDNTSGADVMFEIYDATEPTMICEDGLNVNVDGNGIAVMAAELFDAGSSDACGPFSLRVAIVDDNDELLTGLDEHVVFTCENLGRTRVVLEGTDPSGNRNRCWLDILVEDKTYPTCVPPPDFTLSCQVFSENFDQDLVWDFAADPYGVGEQLDAAFGEVTGVDNCPGTRSLQSINGELNNCGVGQFTRFFRVVDASGLLANNQCRQLINVVAQNDYSIRFPGDETYACGDLPTPEDIVGEEVGCDLLVVTTDIDTLVADAIACYKLRLTHEVINWCEYNSLSPAIDVPRDPDRDGNFAEPVFVNVASLMALDSTDDRAILDQDGIPFNGNDLRDLVPNYGTSSRRGFYRYRQFVRVYDDEDPELTVPAPEAGLAFTENCLGGVILEFTATDNCSAATNTTVSVDVNVVDLNNDGVFTGIDFSVDREIGQSRFVGEPETGVEVFIRNLPIGQHLARVRTTDGCGNQDQRFVVLTVEDGKAPSPSCIQSLSTALMPDQDLGGVGVVWATDYVASPAVVCTDTEISYSIYTEAEAAVPGFIAEAGRNRLDVDCGDVGEVLVRIYAFATSSGRFDFCNAVLHVTDNSGEICADRNGDIAGLVRTENGVPMEEMEVYNDGLTTLVELTDNNGHFRFDGLEEGQDYTIQPYLNRDPINGVTARDINTLARYLLNVDDGLTPYQLIAADANRNGEITIRDLIMIREVILGIKDNFDNNTSWRFVPKDFTFSDPEYPFDDDFPEVANFNDLQGNQFVEFVAVKVGDLDNSARPPQGLHTGGSDNPNVRSSGGLVLRPNLLVADQWDLLVAEGEELGALQLSLDLPAKTAVRSGLIPAEAYHLGDAARLHVAYVPAVATGALAAIPVDEPLLSFTLPDRGELPTLVGTDDSEYFLRAEGYGLQDGSTKRLRLNASSIDDVKHSLSASVFPNPVATTAHLSLDWPAQESVELTVRQLSGKITHRQAFEVAAGKRQYAVSTTNFGNPGIYLLEVRGEDGRMATVRVVKR